MKSSSLIAALSLIVLALQGCAVQKQLVPTGGSRSDGTVKMSYEYGMFEQPEIDHQQGINAAEQRCAAWGYKGAEPFGGMTKQCVNSSNSGCVRWLVTVEYQCMGGTPPKL